MEFSRIIFILFWVIPNNCWATSREVHFDKPFPVSKSVTLKIPLRLLKGQRVVLQLVEESEYNRDPTDFLVNIGKLRNQPALRKKFPQEPLISQHEAIKSYDYSFEQKELRNFSPSAPIVGHPLQKWMFGKTMQKYQPQPAKESFIITGPQKPYDISHLPLAQTPDFDKTPITTGSSGAVNLQAFEQMPHPWDALGQKIFDHSSEDQETKSVIVNYPMKAEIRSPHYSPSHMGTSVLSVQQTNDGIQGFIINVPRRCPPNHRLDGSGHCRQIYPRPSTQTSNRIKPIRTNIITKIENDKLSTQNTVSEMEVMSTTAATNEESSENSDTKEFAIGQGTSTYSELSEEMTSTEYDIRTELPAFASFIPSTSMKYHNEK